MTLGVYIVAVAGFFLFSDDILALIWVRPEQGQLLRYAWDAVATLYLMVVLVVFALFFTTIAEVFGGVFYDQISIHILSEHDIPTQEASFLEGTILDLVRACSFMIPAVMFGLLGLVPVVGIGFTVLATVFVWMGLGSGAVNSVLLVTGHRLSQRMGWARQHRFVTLGMGAIVACGLLVPGIGLVILPASIVGATELLSSSFRERMNA